MNWFLHCRTALRGRLKKHFRRGTSLMEVMFAIGVAGVGILGVASLMPLAVHQAARGKMFDDASNLGREAYRTLQTAGGLRQRQWVYADGSTIDLNSDGVWDGLSQFEYPSAVCIDPRFVAANGAVATFPYPGPATVNMPRITLRAINSDPLALPPPGPINGFHAELLCVSRNGLNFEDPPARTELPPTQVYTSVGGAPTVRQSEESFSWMATLVPEVNRSFSPGSDGAYGARGADEDGDGTADFHPVYPATPDYQEAGAPGSDDIPGIPDSWHLSIVIFHKRNMLAAPIEGKLNSERVCTASFLDGYRGGEVLLSGATKNDVDVNEREWVLVSAEIPAFIGNISPILGISPASITPRPIRVYKWYQVLAADDRVDQVGATWERYVTLDGPDWDATLLPIAQMTIMEGAVAVYEKTVRLEDSGMWEP